MQGIEVDVMAPLDDHEKLIKIEYQSGGELTPSAPPCDVFRVFRSNDPSRLIMLSRED